MGFPKKTNSKKRKTAYRILMGLGGLVLTGALLTYTFINANADDRVSEAQSSTYGVKAAAKISGTTMYDEVINSFMIPGPSEEGMSLLTDNGAGAISYPKNAAASMYCSKGDVLFYDTDQWPSSTMAGPNIFDQQVSTSGTLVLNLTSTVRSNYQVSQRGYYLISDTGYNLSELRTEFADYIYENRSKYLTDTRMAYEQGASAGEFYFRSTSNLGVTITQAAEAALQDFMAEKGAVLYSADKGISLEECNYGEDYTVTLLSDNVVNYIYYYWFHVYSTSSSTGTVTTGTTYNYCGIPMISLTNYPVKMKEYNPETPVVESADGQSKGQVYTVRTTDDNTINSVLKDTSVTLQYPAGLTETQKSEYQINYYLTSTDYNASDVEKLNRWTAIEPDTAIALSSKNLSGTRRYLYVMLREKKGSESTNVSYPYTDSVIGKYEFQFTKAQPAGTISLLSTTGGTDGIDVGEQASLTIDNENAIVLYTTDGTYPELTRYTGASGAPSIIALEAEAGTPDGMIYLDSIAGSSFNYLRVNGYWYRCAKAVNRADDLLTAGSSVRTDNRFLVRARAVQQDCELGSYVTKTLAFRLSNQVELPTADPAALAEDGTTVTTIDMGSRVNFSCITAGAELFYTTNGSAPIVTTRVQDGQVVTVPGNSATIKGNNILVTEDFAAYESNITLMVKAVRYENGVRTMRDSEVARFVYYVGDKSPIEPVQAYPTTDNSTPTELAAGQTVQLSCATQNAEIYYTTNGTDPRRNDDGTVGANTYLYSGGIVVPEQNDTLFTVTALAYVEGLATSDTSRFVYKYPAALAAPYATPGSGSVAENTTVSLKSSTTGAIIYYEIAYNGEEAKNPTKNSNIYDDANPIIVNRATNVKAIAVLGNVTSTVGEFNYTASSKLSAPVPSVESGSVIANGSSITLSADEGALIYYTTDGSNPMDSENMMVNVGKTIFLSGSAGSVITVRTYASKTGYSNSETATYSYTISNFENAVFADRENGSTLKNGDIVNLNTDVTDAVIYYTLDGSTPSILSSQGSRVVITGTSGSTVVLKAMAVFAGGTKTTAVASFTYTITQQLKAPQSSVPSGAVFTEEGQIELTAEAGTIYYTTDGTTPNSGSNVYQTSIPITRGMTVRAIAISEDADDSPVSTYTYQYADAVAKPLPSVEKGQVEIGTEVELSCETAGATIYYTTNGTDPDTDNLSVLLTYAGPITINRAMTLKAVAVKSGMQDSTVMTVGYTVKEPIVVEESTEPAEIDADSGGSTGRLKSRRTFEGAEEGPLFSDIILKNATYGVILSSPFDVIPENSSLSVTPGQYGSSIDALVKQNVGSEYEVVASYDVRVDADGEAVEPDGEIEIGMPIPAKFENSLIYMIYMAEDGSIEVQETRRSGNMAYATVTHVNQYGIVAPNMEKEVENHVWVFLLIGATIVIVAVVVVLISRHRNRYYDV